MTERLQEIQSQDERAMLDELDRRLGALFDEFHTDLLTFEDDILRVREEANTDEGAFAFVDGYLEMARSLRRTPDMVPMEDFYASDLPGSYDPWVAEARWSVTQAPRLLLRIAEEAARGARAARERTLNMLGLALYSRLSTRASDYLGRVARLYIWGFDQELIPMCRSVLEAALNDLLEASSGGKARARQLLHLDSDGGLDLVLLIRVCGPDHLKLIDRKATQLAHDIRTDANKVLHFLAPASERHLNSLELVRNLAAILNQAFPDPYDEFGDPRAPVSTS